MNATADRQTAIPNDPPPGWERETAKYRATRDVHPLPKARSRSEPPYAMVSDNDAWQYADRDVKAGEIIETKCWPHPSFYPLNYTAGKVLDFFNTRQKSRLQLSPWQGASVHLNDGLSGAGPVLKTVRPEPFDGTPRPGFKSLPIAG